MRKLAFITFILTFLAAAGAPADESNYYCVVCGKGPLTGRIWMSKWGPVCDDCAKLPDRCSICGLPVLPGDGHVTTGDGRIICKFDKRNAVLDAAEARQIFDDVRRDVVEMFGEGFALRYPDVTVNLFDVDYWSEKSSPNSLHKFGFASTRISPDGRCTHEVVLLSGRLRDEIASTAAHEYTHLWINENRPASHIIDSDTTEAICELTAYKLMEERNLPEMEKEILENPYTHGKIKTLVAFEKERGIRYILDWVKNGTTTNLDQAVTAARYSTPAMEPVFAASTNVPPLPVALKLKSLLWDGANSRIIVNSVSLGAGETNTVNLRGRTVNVYCQEIHPADAVIRIDGIPRPVTLKLGDSIVP